jgi:predicted Fe-Mo cluster-binding NifX family protein
VRIAIASDDNRGLDGTVSSHFGRCSHYTLVDVQRAEVKGIQIVDNPFYNNHGQSGEVPDFIRGQGASVIITGGMGPKAIGFFNEFGIEAVTGASSMVRDALNNYLSGALSGTKPCREGEITPERTALDSDNLSRLREEAELLQKQFAEMERKIAELEQKHTRKQSDQMLEKE